MKKGDKVKWIDGMGFEHHGIVARDIDSNEFMIPVKQKDDTIIKIAYKNLHLSN